MINLTDGMILAAYSGDWWAEYFFGLDADQRFVILLTTIGCLAGVIISVAGMIYSFLDSANQRRSDLEIKRELLDRGMTADEIHKVMSATSPSGGTRVKQFFGQKTR